ncbi:hypothetical protein BCR44DRAFT_1430651 [Catenaria anguillulae PL171]|uniref:Uncharacterized protein n=1 Tax=Catenaria anguillulae PL171 TaxID=765915 RepID=A0A1Y2HRL7_9FUNG|nr:hypothetical protein BCR44DRAFT_1430651 [Catenaria anguillulae PL171]
MLQAQDEAVVQVSQGSLIVRSKLATFLKLWLPVSSSRSTSIGDGTPQLAVQLAPLDPVLDHLFSAKLVDWLFSSSARAFIDLPARLNSALSVGSSRFGSLLRGQNPDEKDAAFLGVDGGDFDATAVSRPSLAPPLEHTNWQTFPDFFHLVMYFIRSGNSDRLAQSLSHALGMKPNLALDYCRLPISGWAFFMLDNRTVVRQFVFNYTSTANDYIITFADFLFWTACLEWSLPLFLVIEQAFGYQNAKRFTHYLSNSSVMLNTMVDTLGDCTNVDRVMSLLRHLTQDLDLRVNVAKVPYLSLHARTYPLFSALFRDHDKANLACGFGRIRRRGGLVRPRDYRRIVVAVMTHGHVEIAEKVLARVKDDEEKRQVLTMVPIGFVHKAHPPASYYSTLLSMLGAAGLAPKQFLADNLELLSHSQTATVIRKLACSVVGTMRCLNSPSLPSHEAVNWTSELSVQQLALATVICVYTLNPRSVLPFTECALPPIEQLADHLVSTLASRCTQEDIEAQIPTVFVHMFDFVFANPPIATPYGPDVDARAYHHAPAATAFNATHPTDAHARRLQSMLHTLVRMSPGFAAKCVRWHASATIPLWVWPCFASQGVELGKAVQKKALSETVGDLVKYGRTAEVQVLVEAVGGREEAIGKQVTLAMSKLEIKE